MEKFIPYEKLSKKEKRKLNRAGRTTWVMSPVTRKPEPPKAYNRNKARRELRKDCSNGASCFLAFSRSAALRREITAPHPA